MPSLTTTYLITGSSRGIGLELVRQLIRSGATVIATCRDPVGSAGLQELVDSPLLHVLPLDVTRIESIKRAAKKAAALCPEGIDILINNAGAAPASGICTVLDASDFDARNIIIANSLGPMRVTKAFLPLLSRKAASGRSLVVNMSSRVGSISSPVPRATIYSASKAALNAFTIHLSWEFKQKDLPIAALSLHPGWVATAMGEIWGPNSPLSASESVEGMLKVLRRPTADLDGKFLDYTGEEQPW